MTVTMEEILPLVVGAGRRGAPDVVGDREAIVRLLAPLNETERTALRRELKPWFDDWRWGAHLDTLRTRRKGGKAHRALDWGAINLVVLGCAGGVRQAVSWLRASGGGTGFDELAVRVLRQRSPAWLDGLAQALVAADPWGWWWTARALVRAGLCAEPQGPDGVQAMVHGALGPDRGRPSGALALLRDNPDLLEGAVWRLFDTEGIGRSLTSTDEWVTHRWDPETRTSVVVDAADLPWETALITLAETGEIDRGRLLDATLGSLALDWAAADLRWYVGLEKRLDPTPDEVATRQSAYLRLLTAGYGPAIAVAQKRLTALIKPRTLDVDGVLAVSAAVLEAPTKSAAMAQLRLLGRVAKAWPETAGRVCEVATAGMEHPHVDVREAAAGLVTAFGGASVVLGGTPVLPGAAAPGLPSGPRPSGLPPDPPRPGAAAPSGLVDPGPSGLVAAAVDSATLFASSGPGPAPQPFVPIADPAELLDVVVALIEDASDALDTERALDAMMRFARMRLTGQLPKGAESVRRRIDTFWQQAQLPWQGQVARVDIAAVAWMWLDGRDPQGRPERNRSPRRDPKISAHQSTGAWWSLRMREVAQAVAAGGGVLLSTPSYDDATIDPADLVDRLAALPEDAAPLPFDVTLAALRCRGGAGGFAAALAGDRRGVVRASRVWAALDETLDRLGRFAPAWEPVVVTERRWTNEEERSMTWRNSAGMPDTRRRAARLLGGDPLADLLDVRGRSHQRHASLGPDRWTSDTAAWPWLLPGLPDVLAARAHAPLSQVGNSVWPRVEPVLAALGDGDSTAPVVCSALVLGLNAKDLRVRLAAVDAVIALADRGVLDSGVLGVEVSRLLAEQIVVGKRVWEALGDVARGSDAATRAAGGVLVALLPALVGRRDAHVAVNLLAEIVGSLGQPVDLPPEWAELAAGTSRTALARAVRRLSSAGPTGVRAAATP